MMPLKTKRIGFVGGGNMAEALIAGLTSKKLLGPAQIHVSEPRAPRRRQLQKKYRVRGVSDNPSLARIVDVMILAVKPQVMPQVMAELAPHLQTKQLVISIAAGIDTTALKKGLGADTHLIRAMPNTPALIGQGITGLYVSPNASPAEARLAKALFLSVGEVILIKHERQLDAVTAISGSGPAYVFAFLEALRAAGYQAGLTQEIATKLAQVTVQGAAALAALSHEDFTTLRKRVTSKGGTTEAAVKVLAQKRWGMILIQAIRAATRRARELRKET